MHSDSQEISASLKRARQEQCPFFVGYKEKIKRCCSIYTLHFCFFSLGKVLSLTCFPIYHAILWYN